MKVFLFVPCFVDQLYPQTGIAAYRLLSRAGHKPVVSSKQTCCGQPAFNSGFVEHATTMAEKLLRDFKGADCIVTPSGSCAAMLRKHYTELQLSDRARHRLEKLLPSIFELSEFLVDVAGFSGIESEYNHRVVYHPSCHGMRELGIYEQPLKLLSLVDGIDLVRLDDQDRCCGFGGTFSSKFPELSIAMGEDKIEAIIDSGAHTVTATDDSCLMHMEGILVEKQIPIRTLHYSRILAGGELVA